MSSLFCEGCLVAAAVVVRLRFAVENVPAKGALGSSWDKSLIVTVCRSYCRDPVQVGPIFTNILLAYVERLSCGTARADPSWVCFNNETWGGQAEDVQLVLMLKSVSLSGVTNTFEQNPHRRDMKWCETKWRETVSLDRRRRRNRRRLRVRWV